MVIETRRSPWSRAPAGSRPDDGEIVVHGLHKRFAEVKALDDVALRVAPGEIAALLGPNGAGKSTLIRILSTSVLPDGGNAAVCGFDVVAQAVWVRGVVGLMLGDERSFYARLSGRENLEFFAAMHGLPRRVASGLCAQLLERVGLFGGPDPGLADRPYRFWSSGMRARLALARALLGAPRVLLLDEPTGHLDPMAAQELRDLIRTLAYEERLAVLFATHNLQEAADLAAVALVLSGGRLHEVVPGPLDAARLELVVRGAA